MQCNGKDPRTGLPGPSNNTAAGGNLYGAMIHPYTIGPMGFRSAVWYQGEANVGAAAFYACQFPAMIQGWREDLQLPDLWFGFVQIAGWAYSGGQGGVAAGDLRQAQLAALKLNNVGLSTAIDTGDWSNIHPPDKQDVAARLTAQALRAIYGIGDGGAFPIYAGSKLTVAGTTVSVEVSFVEGSTGTGLTAELPLAASQSSTLGKGPDITRAQCVTALPAVKGKVVNASACGYPMIIGADGTSLNATATISKNGETIVLSATAPAGFVAEASSYGRAAWPMTLFFNSGGLPVIPWYNKITDTKVTDMQLLNTENGVGDAGGRPEQYV